MSLNGINASSLLQAAVSSGSSTESGGTAGSTDGIGTSFSEMLNSYMTTNLMSSLVGSSSSEMGNMLAASMLSGDSSGLGSSSSSMNSLLAMSMLGGSEDSDLAGLSGSGNTALMTMLMSYLQNQNKNTGATTEGSGSSAGVSTDSSLTSGAQEYITAVAEQQAASAEAAEAIAQQSGTKASGASMRAKVQEIIQTYREMGQQQIAAARDAVRTKIDNMH